jgi:hypothetical protein
MKDKKGEINMADGAHKLCNKIKTKRIIKYRMPVST